MITEKDIDRIAEKIIEKLKNDKEIKTEKQLTPFQRTEKLLYNLKFLKGALDVKSKKLAGFKNDPVLLQKKDLGVNVQTTKKYLSEVEKIENMIERLEGDIKRLENVIEMTETALDEINGDKYYKVIEMKYFEEVTVEHIAEHLDIGETTVKRNKNRLVKRLHTIMFSNDTVAEILKD